MPQISLEVNTYSREDTLPLITVETPTTNVTSEDDQERSYEEVVEAAVDAEMKNFDAWLTFKVKSELVTQIFSNIGVDDWQIDITAIQNLLRSEVIAEKDVHFQRMTHIENEEIPNALTRTEFKNNAPYYYWQRDVDNLYTRVDVHNRLMTKIGEFELTGPDGMYDLGETFIRRMLPSAKEEVLSLVVSQKIALEAQNVINQVKIMELEAVLEELNKTEPIRTVSSLSEQDWLVA